MLTTFVARAVPSAGLLHQPESMSFADHVRSGMFAVYHSLTPDRVDKLMPPTVHKALTLPIVELET